MTDFLFDKIGVDIIHFIQSFSNPLLDTFFRVITNFGDVPFYLVALALIYWLYSKKTGAHLAAALIIFGFVTQIIKGVVGWTRPYQQVPSDAKAISTATGYSFPSGHSQSTGTFWPVAVHFCTDNTRKKILTILGIVAIFLIPFSRVYLGVHYPGDVVFGLALGLVGAFLYIKLNQPIIDIFKEKDTKMLLSIAVVLGILMLVVEISSTLLSGHDLVISEPGVLSGMFLGAFTGFILENRFLNFNEKPTLRFYYFTRIVIGLITVVLCYGVPHLFFTFFDGVYIVILRHFVELSLVGFGIAFLGPYVFTKFENYWSTRN